MNAFMSLCVLVLIAGIIGYFVLFGICKLIEGLMKKSDGFLKMAMFLVTMIALGWISVQYKHADEIMHDLKMRLINSSPQYDGEDKFEWR